MVNGNKFSGGDGRTQNNSTCPKPLDDLGLM